MLDNIEQVSVVAQVIWMVAMLAVATWIFAIAPAHQAHRAYLLHACAGVATWAAYSVIVAWRSGLVPETPANIIQASWRVTFLGVGLVLGYWLRFVAHATGAPALAWLTGRRGPLIATSVGLGLGIANVVQHERIAGPMSFVVMDVGVGLVGLAVVIAALRARTRAPVGTLERRRANSYLLAFLLYDVTMVTMFGVAAWANYAHAPDPRGALDGVAAAFTVGLGVLIVLFLPALVYAVTTGRVLDSERRFHVGISRAGVLAIFVAVFVGAQTLVTEYLTATAGLAAGAVAAATLVFLLTPLQRAAEGIADKVVPQGRGAAKMSAAEREVFYREQVQIAYSDGSIGPKERTALRNVRERLGLSADQALRIEDAVAA